MGNKASRNFVVDIPLTQNVTLCYHREDSNSRWVYASEVMTFNLNSQTYGGDSYDVLFRTYMSLRNDGYVSYCIDPNNSYENKPLYKIQNNGRLLKSFDHINVKSDDYLSDIFLIDAKSKDAKIDNVFILELEDDYDKIIKLFERSPKTLRQKIKDQMNIDVPLKFDNILLYLVEEDVNIPKTVRVMKEDDSKMPDNINNNLGITIKDIKPEEYPFYFLHSSNDFDLILKIGKICTFGKCDVNFFDEKTGKYLYPKVPISEHQSIRAPGVYMEYLELGDFFMPPIGHNDIFRTKMLHTMSMAYGQLGFIFPLEEIFKYHVNVKKISRLGQAPDVDLMEYHLTGQRTEIIVRANSIDISKASAVHVQFSAIELKFIYTYVPKVMGIPSVKITLQNIIDLYEEQRNNHWYIRKSNLLKVVDGYKALGLDVPPLLCSRINYDNSDKIYDTIYDTDSEPEEELLK